MAKRILSVQESITLHNLNTPDYIPSIQDVLLKAQLEQED
jgi:hypothetical protein